MSQLNVIVTKDYITIHNTRSDLDLLIQKNEQPNTKKTQYVHMQMDRFIGMEITEGFQGMGVTMVITLMFDYVDVFIKWKKDTHLNTDELLEQIKNVIKSQNMLSYKNIE